MVGWRGWGPLPSLLVNRIVSWEQTTGGMPNGLKLTMPLFCMCIDTVFINSAVSPQKPVLFVDVEMKEGKTEERNWYHGLHSISCVDCAFLQPRYYEVGEQKRLPRAVKTHSKAQVQNRSTKPFKKSGPAIYWDENNYSRVFTGSSSLNCNAKHCYNFTHSLR